MTEININLHHNPNFKPLNGIKPRATEAEIDKASQDFEAVFLSQMLNHMFKEVKIDPMSDDNYADGVYKNMLVDEYGKILAKTGGIGIADYVKKEMIEMQGGL